MNDWYSELGLSAQEIKKTRWRLILGQESTEMLNQPLTQSQQKLDECLHALYDGRLSSFNLRSRSKKGRQADRSPSKPSVSRWLGDIQTYFPHDVVKIMQQDAIDRLGLTALLFEKELLEQVEVDVHLVSQLISLKNLIPAETKETARLVVKKVLDELMQKLQPPMQEAIHGTLNRAIRNARPRHNEIDWQRTILSNLKHYQPDYKTIIPAKKIGFGRKRSSLKDVILCVDQSASMASSVVYSSIYAAVMAALPALSTRLVVFDTSVVDLSEQIQGDPVDLLFGLNLGGGTNINRAIAYCEGLITRPEDSILILISDLVEGGDRRSFISRMSSLVSQGVQCISLVTLSDEGRPHFDTDMSAELAKLGLPCFACTPQMFPDLMAKTLSKVNIKEWASTNNIPMI